jgi:sulfate adenylyltransferase subunit 2
MSAVLKQDGKYEPFLWPAVADEALESDHLDWLESEAIHIMREVVAETSNPALLFSGGKDSIVMLRLAEKAFRPDSFPFPLVHIDTEHNFQEVIDFRDHRAAELGERLIVRSVQASIDSGRVVLRREDESRNIHQTVTLLDAIKEFEFDALFGGARRDEEKARAKERILSHRDEFGQWNPKNQRPELWDLYNARQYIARENLQVPSIYYAHEREVIERSGLLVPVTPLTQPRAGEKIVTRTVRFRTVGDITCTCPVLSRATDIGAILTETVVSRVTERGATRMDDQTSDASMELRKKEGYF